MLPVVLSVLALVLAGSALGLSLVNSSRAGPAGSAGVAGAPGARGPAGANGSPGAPGPGAIVNQTRVTVGQQLSNVTCGELTTTQISFKVTAPGTVVVTATAEITLNHQSIVNTSEANIYIGNTTTDCSGQTAFITINSGSPATSVGLTLSLTVDFVIPSAGTYTFYLNGVDASQGPSAPAFYLGGTMVGVYYHS